MAYDPVNVDPPARCSVCHGLVDEDGECRCKNSPRPVFPGSGTHVTNEVAGEDRGRLPAVSTTARFDIARHNDQTYDPPHPWTDWCTYANCWTCYRCGAAAGWRFHNPGCNATTAPRAQGDER